MKKNIPFDNTDCVSIRNYLIENNLEWTYDYAEEQNEEAAFFFFTGIHKSREVVFDVFMMPLSLHYMALAEEIADQEVQKLFPEYRGYESVNNLPEKKLEEIWEKKAEIIAEIEAEDNLKVQEFIEIDDSEIESQHNDLIVMLTVVLNIDEINEEIIDKFVKDYKNNTLRLDENLYSFSIEDDLD
ncbi:MAG: hypothetical protein OHK0045_16060 [Raineya sp.]